MPFVEAKCTSCGAAVNMDDTCEGWFCGYCGTRLVVKDIICTEEPAEAAAPEVGAAEEIIEETVSEPKPEFVICSGVLEEYNGSDTEVVVPDNVTTIGSGVFEGMPVKAVKLPVGVRRIWHNAFAGCCELNGIELPEGIKVINGFRYSGLESIRIPESVDTISMSAFSGCHELKSVELSEGLREISGWAFENCSELKSINIPETVTELGPSAFEGCTSLESVTITSPCIKLNRKVFSGCTSLRSVTLPDNVEFMGFNNDSFVGCDSLTEIKYTRLEENIDKFPAYQAFLNKPAEDAAREAAQREINESIKKRKCPYCGERINILTGKCSGCKENFSEAIKLLKHSKKDD